MYLVIGLGNIGSDYSITNHNVGFLVVEKLAKMLSVSKEKRECDSLVSECNVGGNKIMLARPTTYMNASGIAVCSLEKKYKPNEIIVVQDDADLPEGAVRIRNRGSAGTHNGMKSVISYIKKQDFIRIRVGIGKQKEGQDMGDFVLSRIPRASKVWQGIDNAADAVYKLVTGTSLEEVCQEYSK